MKHLLLALCAFACACATPPQPAATPITIGETLSLRSSVLNETREINVWLPPGYRESEDRYNVLYVLDGGLDQDFQHIAGLGQLGALSWTYETLIVVGVRSNVRRHELTPAIVREPRLAAELPEAGGAADFRAFLQREVIPFVETHYRTGPRRTLIGESLGGLFVVDTLLRQPELFHDYIAISPSLWWDNKALGHDAATLLVRQTTTDRRLYLTIGDEGGAMQTGVDLLRAALEQAPEGAVQWRYVDRSATERHDTIYHGAALDALRWLYALAPADYGQTPWYYLNESERPTR
jgi:predicted alpha/beta superfamily hydrolase